MCRSFLVGWYNTGMWWFWLFSRVGGVVLGGFRVLRVFTSSWSFSGFVDFVLLLRV